MFFFVVSFEEYLFGAMMSVTEEDNFSTTSIHVGGTYTHGEEKLALEN